MFDRREIQKRLMDKVFVSFFRLVKSEDSEGLVEETEFYLQCLGMILKI